ncbi:hypothetical protein CRM22_001690, partial [Opisthorchis felineus]
RQYVFFTILHVDGTIKHLHEILLLPQEFDQDGDGYICAEELRVLMASFGEPLTHDDIMEMIQEADTDGDGKVNFEEFLQVLQ